MRKARRSKRIPKTMHTTFTILSKKMTGLMRLKTTKRLIRTTEKETMTMARATG